MIDIILGSCFLAVGIISVASLTSGIVVDKLKIQALRLYIDLNKSKDGEK